MRIAVLGLGVMGRQHLRVLSSLRDAELVAVGDISDEARAWAERTLSIPSVAHWKDIPSFKPEAVINATPSGLHFESTRFFLESNVHVLVEKPLATTTQEAANLAELARRNGLVLMVGHVERFNPAVQALKREIDSGKLGRIISMSSRRLGIARPAVPHVNVVLDLATHDIDVFSHLLGRPGRLLLASGASMDSNVLEDHVDLVLRYGETAGFIQANWITPVKIRRLSITGTKGFAEVDYIAQSVYRYDAAPDVIKGMPWDFFAVSRESDPVKIPVIHGEPLLAELEHFIDCVLCGRQPVIGPEESMRALALAIEATNLIRGRSS